MTNDELNTLLYHKMLKEQELFKERLRNSSAQEVMKDAYEFVIREDILLSLEENDLTDKQAKSLLKFDHPLSDLFNAWENRESRHMDEIRETITSYADEAAKKAREKSRVSR